MVGLLELQKQSLKIKILFLILQNSSIKYGGVFTLTNQVISFILKQAKAKVELII